MSEIGKFLFLTGLMLAAVGLVVWLGVGKTWIGRLPGDIHLQKGSFSFYFPVVTCLLLSLLITLILWIFRR